MSSSSPAASPAAAPGRASPTLSIVVPCYNEEEALPILLDRLGRLGADLAQAGAIAGAPELVLVDDGSRDATWPVIAAAARRSGPVRVRGVRLARNYGHQRALLAGLFEATGDMVISMDADLQDDPAVIGEMIAAYRSGADIVYGVRGSRDTDTRFKRATARGYYRLLARMGVDLVPDHADFRLMSRRAVAALATFGETNIFLRGLVRQLGFPSAIVRYDRAERAAGVSKYPLRKMLALAFEGVTSFSVQPLRLITLAGFAVAGLSFLYACWSVAAFLMGRTVTGWTSIIVPIYLLGGLHLIALGVIGEYIGKIYQETKRRPRYLIDEVLAPEAQPATTATVEPLPPLKVAART